jgi:hypothetical protein
MVFLCQTSRRDRKVLFEVFIEMLLWLSSLFGVGITRTVVKLLPLQSWQDATLQPSGFYEPQCLERHRTSSIIVAASALLHVTILSGARHQLHMDIETEDIETVESQVE